jgi:hypothetical protein
VSTSSILFGSYFAIGLISMIVAVATRGKERRTQMLDVNDGTYIGTGMMILIALLWPLWICGLFFSKDDPR